MKEVPVPHHPVLPQHVAPEQIEVVSPCGREERVRPEQVTKSYWYKGHPGITKVFLESLDNSVFRRAL